MKPRFDRYDAIGLAVALVVVAPPVWMALDDAPVLSVTGFRLLAEPVPPGATLTLRYRAIFARRCSGQAQRVFVDSTGHVMAIDPYEFRDGVLYDGTPVAIGVERELPLSRAPVPYGAAPGPARYQNVTHFYCNPLQKMFGKRWGLGITFRYPVVDFTIAPGVVPVQPPTSVFAPAHREGVPEILDDEAPPPPPRRTTDPKEDQ